MPATDSFCYFTLSFYITRYLAKDNFQTSGGMLMYSFFKERKKTGRWKNPDFYIALSFLSYFLFVLMFLFAPHVTAFLHGGRRVAQVLTVLFLIAGALFSGIGNWFGFGYEVYPGYMEEPSKEVLEELDAMLQERRRELREAKRSETEKS